MFPLGSVLLPHGSLPLHIFEPRYRVLMFDCLRAEREFGVVLIERGREIGGGDQRFTIGTVARIDEAIELADGRWLLNAVGTRRIRVVEWLPDDPYPLATVEDLAEAPWSAGADAARLEAEPVVTNALALAVELAIRLGSGPAALEPQTEPGPAGDPHAGAWRLIGAAPLGSLDRQELLEVDDPAGRLRRLAVLTRDQASMLAFRLDQE